MRLELKDIESTKARDMVRLANRASELTNAMGLVQSIVSNVITIIGLAFIIVRLDGLFILLVVVTLSIKTILVHIQNSFRKNLRKLETENDRYIEYLHGLSYHSEGGAKEIRLNSLQKWYMEKMAIYRNKMLGMNFKSFRMYAGHNVIMAVISVLQSFIILSLLSVRYINDTISIADFTMYFSAVVALGESLSSIAEQLGNYFQQILNVNDYHYFIDMIKFQNNGSAHEVTVPTLPSKTEIVFDNVCFSYPNNEKQVLTDINIKIKDKEKVVIVGANGAGKSTFIKLLCKFYKPTSGVITLNGTDIWDMPNEYYYKIISAVFQDFSNLPFTLKENIAMDENGDMDKIVAIIKSINLKERVDELPDTYDTYLTKSFDSNGIELSGGQAQKIAIARAIYKDAPLLILDEPTANLDPKAESEIYKEFFNMAKDKTTIFISHRLASSTIADNILVFSDGKIIEFGSHDALIKRNAVYADMYHKQSQQYSDEKAVF
jgi:ABC-type multidrug transport system fused ATPase/permease subunit